MMRGVRVVELQLYSKLAVPTAAVVKLAEERQKSAVIQLHYLPTLR